MVSREEPPSGNPSTFRLLQSWVPLTEGEVRVSVVAYDVDRNSSDEVTISLIVAAAAGDLPGGHQRLRDRGIELGQHRWKWWC